MLFRILTCRSLTVVVGHSDDLIFNDQLFL